jgi:hypothetical protein
MAIKPERKSIMPFPYEDYSPAPEASLLGVHSPWMQFPGIPGGAR